MLIVSKGRHFLINATRILRRNIITASSGASKGDKKKPYDATDDYTYDDYIKNVLLYRKEKEFDYESLIKKPDPRLLQPHKPPFLKNLFSGTFDTDIFAFPEPLDKARLLELVNNVELVEKYFKDNIDPIFIDRYKKIPNEVLETMKDLRLFSQKIPPESGGLGYLNTGYARIMEIIAQDLSLAVTQYTHEILCLKAIWNYGTDKLKDKYLKKLTSGDWFGSYCLTESTDRLEDINLFNTTAVNSSDGWLLNGRKTYVANGHNSNLFIVIAKTTVPESERSNFEPIDKMSPIFYYRNETFDAEIDYNKGKMDNLYNYTAFAVEKNSPGVTVTSQDTLGLCGANFCNVTFENILVPAENVLGDINQGTKIALLNPTEDRCVIGSMCVTASKKLMNDLCEYSLKNQSGFSRLSEQGIVQYKLGKISSRIYAMESMIYLTTGLLDVYEDPDCMIESSIVKVFCTEMASVSLDECLEIYGFNSYMNTKPYERYMRDTKFLQMFDVDNETLKLYISSWGLEHISEKSKAGESTFKYLKEFSKTSWILRANLTDKPILRLKLYQFLHPSLTDLSNSLEAQVIRFYYAVHVAISEHGPMIVRKEMPLKRIADCVILIYAMIAVLSRASRAYCVGHRYCTEDIRLADIFIRDHIDILARNLDILVTQQDLTIDAHLEDLATLIIKNKGYFIPHPLEL